MGGGGMWGNIIESASAGLQAIVGNNAIDKASNAQVNGQRDANANLQRQWDVTQGYLQPYRQAGQDALNNMMAQYGNGGRAFSMADFMQDPGYQFRLQEGQKALERAASAKGMMLSGAQQKALLNYGQNMGSQEYAAAYGRYNNDQNTLFSRLSSLAGMGLSAASQNANLSNAYGNAMSEGIANVGNLEAAGTMAKYRNWQTQDSRAAGAWSGQSGSGGFGNWFGGGK